MMKADSFAVELQRRRHVRYQKGALASRFD